MKPIQVLDNDGSYALARPDYVNSVFFTSAGSTAKDLIIPTSLGVTHVFFGADCNFSAQYRASAGTTAPAVYGSTTTDGSAAEVNPTARFLGKNQIAAISVISPTSGYITASLYNSGST